MHTWSLLLNQRKSRLVFFSSCGSWKYRRQNRDTLCLENNRSNSSLLAPLPLKARNTTGVCVSLQERREERPLPNQEYSSLGVDSRVKTPSLRMKTFSRSHMGLQPNFKFIWIFWKISGQELSVKWPPRIYKVLI